MSNSKRIRTEKAKTISKRIMAKEAKAKARKGIYSAAPDGQFDLRLCVDWDDEDDEEDFDEEWGWLPNSCWELKTWCEACGHDWLRQDIPRVCECGTKLVWRCPFVRCRYHLYLDINRSSGSIKMNFPDVEEPIDLARTCSMERAMITDHTLEEVGVMMNLTKERVRQIETMALGNQRYRLERMGVVAEDLVDVSVARQQTMTLDPEAERLGEIGSSIDPYGWSDQSLTVADRVESYLEEFGPSTVKEIVEATGATSKVLGAAISSWAKYGRFYNVGDGTWTLRCRGPRRKVLGALSSGSQRFGELVQATGYPPKTVANILNRLKGIVANRADRYVLTIEKKEAA